MVMLIIPALIAENSDAIVDEQKNQWKHGVKTMNL
jgi:hypothetical protein